MKITAQGFLFLWGNIRDWNTFCNQNGLLMGFIFWMVIVFTYKYLITITSVIFHMWCHSRGWYFLNIYSTFCKRSFLVWESNDDPITQQTDNILMPCGWSIKQTTTANPNIRCRQKYEFNHYYSNNTTTTSYIPLLPRYTEPDCMATQTTQFQQ